jgi:hypothetical protein
MLLQPFTEGHYIGETDIAEAPSRAAACFAASHWRRLQELREKHDPDQLFQGFSGGIS